MPEAAACAGGPATCASRRIRRLRAPRMRIVLRAGRARAPPQPTEWRAAPTRAAMRLVARCSASRRILTWGFKAGSPTGGARCIVQVTVQATVPRRPEPSATRRAAATLKQRATRAPQPITPRPRRRRRPRETPKRAGVARLVAKSQYLERAASIGPTRSCWPSPPRPEPFAKCDAAQNEEPEPQGSLRSVSVRQDLSRIR